MERARDSTDATSDDGVGLLLGRADQEAPAGHGFLPALGRRSGRGLVNGGEREGGFDGVQDVFSECWWSP
jgi:hypothetical protein